MSTNEVEVPAHAADEVEDEVPATAEVLLPAAAEVEMPAAAEVLLPVAAEVKMPAAAALLHMLLLIPAGGCRSALPATGVPLPWTLLPGVC